ncbi:xylose isomerase-like protein [Rhizodiscina lignyota]|uniref:Xylose isomerase-like protein n=1 Tax=Rhizodiscina lignyota TaxID=1504668 RepID=A0A9P4I933_9PEZI|nr:xylose isomerase-like protein [Rhizodiscina lignyota]
MVQSSDIRIAISTNSLGKSAAGHGIHRKMEAARAHGFDGVEVAWECLEAHATSGAFSGEPSHAERLRAAARDVVKKADSLSLEIIAVNPFGFYDSLADPEDIEARLKEAELWCQVCNILRASIFQQMRDILALVNLPNVRFCMDTFHIAAKEAGDPFNASSPVRPDASQRLKQSLEELKRTVKAGDIGYFQLSDATVADPEQKGYPMRDLKQPPFMTQSRNCRIFPCEPQHGGTLPALDVAKAIFDIGYRGWVSMEVFHLELWKPSPS